VAKTSEKTSNKYAHKFVPIYSNQTKYLRYFKKMQNFVLNAKNIVINAIILRLTNL
jgi:hypothetical protein